MIRLLLELSCYFSHAFNSPPENQHIEFEASVHCSLCYLFMFLSGGGGGPGLYRISCQCLSSMLVCYVSGLMDLGSWQVFVDVDRDLVVNCWYSYSMVISFMPLFFITL